MLCKFRCNNFKLPIECGRWNNTPRAQHFCNICTQNKVGDEFHYVFECTQHNITIARKSLLPEELIKNPNILKLIIF